VEVDLVEQADDELMEGCRAHMATNLR
jgi:hypothetical protein